MITETQTEIEIEMHSTLSDIAVILNEAKLEVETVVQESVTEIQTCAEECQCDEVKQEEYTLMIQEQDKIQEEILLLNAQLEVLIETQQSLLIECPHFGTNADVL